MCRAKDKATGKEQKIVIKASTGLNEEEIKRMVKDAEAHAEEDRKFRELVESRNKADALVHATEKALKDMGEKVPAGRSRQHRKCRDRPEARPGGDDKDVIEKKAAEACSRLAAALSQQSAEQPWCGGPGAQRRSAAVRRGGNDDVLDAEFEEVKDKKAK